MLFATIIIIIIDLNNPIQFSVNNIKLCNEHNFLLICIMYEHTLKLYFLNESNKCIVTNMGAHYAKKSLEAPSTLFLRHVL